MIQTSIVIPVFNKWDLTRNCLKSLAATVDLATTEVIVVDNASNDSTQAGCSFLGRQLFGDSFVYVRNDTNRNFAGASNQGARMAKGEWLLFLNNDTILSKDWLEPLHADFQNFQNLAATGPLLVYEPVKPFGHTVQHLGVIFLPHKKVGHLYGGIPASSPLARKRRFFQAITAACMLMPKRLFLDCGAFDEGFINGFEDLDLCARLLKDGWRMTVNPQSVVTHLESKSKGRHAFEKANSERIYNGNYKYFHSDWEDYLNADDLELGVNEWLNWQIKMPKEVLEDLDQLPGKVGRDKISALVQENPFWQKGWEELIRTENNPEIRMNIRDHAYHLVRVPEMLLDNYEDAKILGNQQALKVNKEKLNMYLFPPAQYLQLALHLKEMFGQEEKDAHLAPLFGAWAEQYVEFMSNVYAPFYDRMKKLGVA